jgi:hypothetical protein
MIQGAANYHDAGQAIGGLWRILEKHSEHSEVIRMNPMIDAQNLRKRKLQYNR